jgi:SAM-dependent methyltransferase
MDHNRRGAAHYPPAGAAPTSKELQASSFGAAAASYARSRPGYPTAALDWLIPSGAERILDVGAGTGQLTRQLVSRGLEVTAVEPSPEMRGELIRSTAGARVLSGSAESIPLPAASVDVVLVAQAWHWVDYERAVPEVARVLAPGGRIGLVWNIRDARVPWVATLGQIMYQYTHQEGDATPILFAPFEQVEHVEVGWSYELASDDLIELVASRSYVITLPADQRDALLADVTRLIATQPALAGKPRLQLPYVTQCTRARLPSG